MTSRERVRRAIGFGSPDRVPVMHGVLPAAYYTHGQALIDLLEQFPSDFGPSRETTIPKPEDLHPLYRSGRHTDEWGVEWDNDQEGMLGIPVVHPLEDWGNWSSYKLPEIPSAEEVKTAHSRSDLNRDYYIFGFGTNIFERMQWLRGYQNLLVDIAMDSEEAYTLRDAMVEWSIEWGTKSAQSDCDGAHFSDDWGTQISLIISPDAWRKFYKPAYKKMFEPLKAKGKHIHFHSDGFTWDIMHDLMEVGVDVLNIQHTVMGLDKIAKEFGGKVAFRSDLDRQHILPNGTRQQIRDHVKETIDALGSYGGGLIGHGEIGPDVPLDNIRAMLEAWQEFGEY